MKDRKNYVGLLLVALLIFVVIAFKISSYYEGIRRHQEGERVLQQVIENVENKDYEDALELLNRVPLGFSSETLTSRQISNLHIYLKIRTTYDSDDFESVKNAQNQLEKIMANEFSNISSEVNKELNTFKNAVFERYDYLRGIEYAGIIPYKGMSENSLYDTEWGTPFKVVERGLITDVETYYFYKVGGKVYLVLARRWRRSTEGTVENIYLVYKKSDGEIGLINTEFLQK